MRVKKRNPLFVLIILIVLIILGGWLYWQHLNLPVDKNGSVKAFVIQKGESTPSIADRLKGEELIRSSLAFKIYLKTTNQAGNIQAGTFKLSPAMSFAEIMANLSSGAEDIWVTLIEGWRVEEMAERLNKELGIKNQEFIDAAKEGYMFPDTYLFNKDATALDIDSIMQNTFKQKVDQGLQNKIKAQGLTLDEGVILASIVEREARSDEVRTNVASILLKRLENDMGLNADATLQYILGYQEDEKGWWKKSLVNADKLVESPYNTYKYKGLPPGPICNPSLSSLRAVANADTSMPYVYYFHDSKGNTYYGRTLEEHNRNVAKYR